jgi:CubicO group peptidase (beta-lactamase class C family)
VARLLTHTAGLPLHFQFFYADDGYGPPSMDTTVARYAILVSPPGETYTYSNLGFGILEHMIGRVSGRNYATFLRDEVFRPLGLSRTSVDTPPGSVDSAAVRYLEDGTPLPPYTFDHVGASAIYASAHDLVRFGMFHLGEALDGGRPILRPETLEQMQVSASMAEAPGLARGLGWAIVEDDNGLRRVYHTGSMPGVSTILNLYPEERLVVVVLMNGYSPPSRGRIADQITAALIPRFALRLAAPPAIAPAPSPIGFDAATWSGRWTGSIVTYQGDVPLVLNIGPAADVKARVGNEPEQPLDQISYANGVLTGRLPGRIPTPDASRHPHAILVNLRLRGRQLTGFVAAIDAGRRGHFALSSWASLIRQ